MSRATSGDRPLSEALTLTLDRDRISILAYRRSLALPSDAEPTLRGEGEQVRAELARMGGIR